MTHEYPPPPNPTQPPKTHTQNPKTTSNKQNDNTTENDSVQNTCAVGVIYLIYYYVFCMRVRVCLEIEGLTLKTKSGHKPTGPGSGIPPCSLFSPLAP